MQPEAFQHKADETASIASDYALDVGLTYMRKPLVKYAKEKQEFVTAEKIEVVSIAMIHAIR
jgi:hypothetical protein